MIPLEYWESFIDNNADKYLKVFKKGSGKAWFTDFHFPAFFIPFEWMAYRKMYWQALVGWLASVLLAFGAVCLFPIAPALVAFGLPLLVLALRAVFAMYAYAIYKRHCLRNLKRSLGCVADGGVSILGVVIFATVCDLLATFLIQPILTALIYNAL